MKIVTPTRLKIAPQVGRLKFPAHSLTLIIKGTFDLKPGGPAVLAEEQASPTGEEFYPDDPEKTGSPRYESDFACFKMATDLLLVGACHAPNGRPAVSCPATFRVGEKTKTIGVVGNRQWKKHWLSWEMTEPEPFTRMELRYENSFGGGKFSVNPVGKGVAEEHDDAGEIHRPLPNLENPAQQIKSHGDHPAPAGFGPLSRAWAARQAKLGTYKKDYRKTRWPWFPEDMDWTYFNAAPADQQLAGYLRGDERLAFENLHPQHARYESQLPSLRVRCFLRRAGGVSPGPLTFEEMDLRLDTLWVDMEAEKLVLVWRGWTPVANEEHEEIHDCYVISESLVQSPAPLQRHYREFMALEAGADQPFTPEAPPPPPKPPADPDPAATAAARQKDKEETLAKLQAQTAALNAQVGFDKMPPAMQQQTREAQAKLMEQLAENDPIKSARLFNAARRAELDQTLGKLGLDPKNLPPLTDKARAEQARLFSELGLEGGDMATDPQMIEYKAILGAVFGKAATDPENLEPLIAEAKKLKTNFGLDQEKPPVPPPPAVPPLTPARVQARITAHGSFEGADLRGLDLSGLNLKGADFAGANLAGVPMRKTNLEHANLSKANLAGADLTEANLTNANAAKADFTGAQLRESVLKNADLAGARMTSANLTKAVLDGALLESADLTQAILTGASAIRTNFHSACLTGGQFQKGLGMQADFGKATLSDADFREANLTEACLLGAIGKRINLARSVLTKVRAGGGSDFSGGNFTQAHGDGAMFKQAGLAGADFRHASLPEAVFTAAQLPKANLCAANLKLGRFNKANLREAKMIKLNLFQGTFQRADLTQADLSGSNLYEVEFLDAVLDRTVTENANLTLTKLEPL